MRGDFWWEFVDEAIVIFAHNYKSAMVDEYLLNPAFEFAHLFFFQFDVLSASTIKLAIENDASLHVGRRN